MKELTKSEKLRAFIAPKITDIITFLDKNGKPAVYEGGDIHIIYRYLEMIGDTTTLTTSGHRFHHFGPSYSRNNDASTLQTVIAALFIRQKLFVNDVEELDTKMMHASALCLIIPQHSQIFFCLMRRAAITG